MVTTLSRPPRTCLGCPAEVPQSQLRGRPKLRCAECIRRYKNESRRAIRAGATSVRACLGCDGDMPVGAGVSYCALCRESRKEPRSRPWRLAACPCGEIFETVHPTKKYCRTACPSRRRLATHERWRYPRSKGRCGRPWRRVRAQVIAEESHCWLCGLDVDKELRYPDSMSASADHVVPISKGGDPLERSNLRLAHMTCNQRRRRRLVDVQDRTAPRRRL